MSTATSFNLIDEPWIRVRDRQSRLTEVSLTQAFADATQYVGLAGDVPTQDAALLRLLLAVLRRSHPQARTSQDWARLWDAGAFDPRPITDYLDRHRDRFDLLHPQTPFFQVAELRTAKGELTSLARLVPDVPAGHQYFTTRSRSALASMSFAEASRWVVHAQAYEASGIKSGAVGDDRVTGGKGYPIGIAWCGWLGLVIVEGANLFETLMLNLALGRPGTRADRDLPPWERDPQGPAVEVRPGAPYGPVDLLTWQSRRIRLGHDGQRATGVLIANGDPLHPRDRFREEFMTGWRYSETQVKALKSADPVYMPRAHVADRAVWRGLGSLLQPTDDSARTKAGRWMEWLAELRYDEVLPASHRFRLRTVGVQYGSQSSVIDDITDDVLPIHLAVVADPRIRSLAVDAVGDAERASQALGQLASDLTRAAGGDRELCGAARSEAREQGYAALDAPYRRWAGGLDTASDREVARPAWRRTVHATVSQLGRQLLSDASTAAWAGLPTEPNARPVNAATAASWFSINLRQALSATAAPPKGQAT